MGSCCSNVNSVEEVESSKNKKRQLPKMKNPKKFDEKQKFIMKINDFIDKYRAINTSFEIKKLSIVQLWNYMKLYPNLKNSNFILLNNTSNDYFTEISNKIDHVGDIINSSKYRDDNVLDSLRKYLDLKNLIVISIEKSLHILDKLLDFFANKKIRCLVYLLDIDLDFVSDNMNSYMFKHIHSSILEKFPYCVLSYNRFKNIQSNGYFFVDISYKLSKKQYFTDNEEKSLFNNFLKDLNVNYVIEINEDETNLEKTNFIKKEMAYYFLNSVKSLQDFIQKKSKFDKIVDNLLKILGYSEKEVDILNKQKENSFLLVFNKEVPNEVQIYIIFLLLNRIFALEPDKIKKYMINNINYIKDVKTYINNNFANMITYLEKSYNYLKREKINDNLLNDKESLKNLIYIKDKFEYYIKQYKNQVDEVTFNKSIEIIDKIITNIIKNPKEEKYYRIKTSSEVFNNYVLSNENTIKILELFGFCEVTINEVDYYKINEEININYLKGLNFDFKEVLKK